MTRFDAPRPPRCPTCLTDVDTNLCRCGARLDLDHRGVRRAYTQTRRGIWQVTYQRRPNSAEAWADGFSDAPEQVRSHRANQAPPVSEWGINPNATFNIAFGRTKQPTQRGN